jgi:RNA polymerase sigma-70 factor (ECF subfamily)
LVTPKDMQTSNAKLQPRNEVTSLLLAWRNGDEHALEQLTPLVYSELRKIARGYVARERRDLTLQPTALINEAYVRLIDMRQPDWQNRTHFYALAAQMMRRILVDFARARGYQKRGGGAAAVTLVEGLASSERGRDLVALDEALKALAIIDPRKSRIVELRFFGGLSAEETAEVLEVSSKTVLREWQTAKVWLSRELAGTDAPHDGQ